MNIIDVKNLRKTFTTVKRGQGLKEAIKSFLRPETTTKEALNNVNFTIKEGEIVGLIGPNGAGKSTCLKILCGLLWPDSGEATILGMQPWKNRVKYVQHIGAVFGQKTTLFWDLPPLDSFHLSKDLYAIPAAEFEERKQILIKLLEAEDIAKQPTRELSLGERMRCEVIQALLHNPKLVFLDEPTIGLDLISKEKLHEFILDLNKKQKTTFIITTHDMQDIEKLCKRIIIINHGTIIYDGPLEAIKKKYFTDKHIDITFSEQVKTFSHKGCKVLTKTPYKIQLELDTRTTPIQTLISHLLKQYDVADITVSDPPIEEIIKKIYRE
ncbi:ATP-binding cassette domain-containing protein [Candidatus Woesearchaeota archaeon]|nr:ATP-binding cassette domain-containing protein [Candidatus Woesearchaeota archaeon]